MRNEANHDCSGRALLSICSILGPSPALSDVWALCLFADGVETEPSKVTLDGGVGSACGDGMLQEGWQSRSEETH
jgi:hypothetical protein